MLKHYTSPNLNRVINFEPIGPKCVFNEGHFATENEKTQELLEKHPQFGIQFFCDEYIKSNTSESEPKQEFDPEFIKELVLELKRLRAENAELKVATKESLKDDDNGIEYDDLGRPPMPKDGRCQEITSSGTQCMRKATTFIKGKWMCPTHEQKACKVSLNTKR